MKPASVRLLDAQERTTLINVITEQSIDSVVARYAGRQPVTENGPVILSRHTQHQHNSVAVAALAADLDATGAGRLRVRRHSFVHNGRTLDNIEATLPADGLDGIIVLSAHIDSTAKSGRVYNPVSDPAPGADDNASGISAVICGARGILALNDTMPGTRRREIRFLLFNAEEDGLVGSRIYASEQSQLGARVIAVFQLDTIGHDGKPPRTFEVHAGCSRNADVQERSLRLADLIAATVQDVSPGLEPPQIYPGPEPADPGEARSDHYSFHTEKYAACLITEDFYAGPGPHAPADPNPNYHKSSDVSIDHAYAADIARTVTAAAWLAATR